MSEAQAYLALPHFLRGFALNQFESMWDMSTSENGGVTCWPEAVQYLLRSYAKRRCMISAGSSNWKAKTSVTIATDSMTRAVVPVMFLSR